MPRSLQCTHPTVRRTWTSSLFALLHQFSSNLHFSILSLPFSVYTSSCVSAPLCSICQFICPFVVLLFSSQSIFLGSFFIICQFPASISQWQRLHIKYRVSFSELRCENTIHCFPLFHRKLLNAEHLVHSNTSRWHFLNNLWRFASKLSPSHFVEFTVYIAIKAQIRLNFSLENKFNSYVDYFWLTFWLIYSFIYSLICELIWRFFESFLHRPRFYKR